MKVSDLPAFIKDAQAISFIIGAGASKTAGIPLASELVDRIKSEKGHCLSDLSETEKTNYGKVMAALSQQERKELIEDCLDKAKLLSCSCCSTPLHRLGNHQRRCRSGNADRLRECSCVPPDHL